MGNCLDNNCHECDDCLEPDLPYKKDKCKDSDQALTKCVIHNGENGTCVPFVAGESLSSIIKKFDEAVCDFVAGSDRRVAVDPADTLPGTLQDKIIDSQYIKWSVEIVGGVRKFQAEIDFEALAPAMCSYCSANPPVTSTTTTVAPTSTTTTIAPTTTTTSTTTTLQPNIEVQSTVPGSSVVAVAGATGYTLPGNVNNGEIVSGRHNSFNGSIGVTVSGTPINKSIVLRRNGVDLQCIDVNGAGTFTFDPAAFILTDLATIEYRNVPCPVVTSTTTTIAPTTTSTTTTVAPTTTTTLPTNVVVQSSVSGTSITTVGGISGFNLSQSVEAGEVIVGNHGAFTGAISATIFGIVSGAKIILSRNGIQLQCLDVNGQGTVTFNSFAFLSTDTINISFSTGPCVVVPPTTTTTTLPPCRTYQVTNNTGSSVNVNYTACNGSATFVSIANNSNAVFCAIDGSVQQIVGISVVLLNASCYNCFTYSLTATAPSATYTYVDCSGTTVNGGLSGTGSTVTICATQGTVFASGATIVNNGYGCSLTTTTTTVAPTTTSTTTTLAPTTTSTTTTVAPTTTSTTTTVAATTTTTDACVGYNYYQDTDPGGPQSLTWIDCSGVEISETVTVAGSNYNFCATSILTYPSGGTLTPGTCTDFPPVARIYYGRLSDGNTPTAGEIAAGDIRYGSITNVSTLNWGTHDGPEYYWFAIPSVHATKAYWYQGPLNNGNIGTGSDLFNAPATVTVGGVAHKVYITNYGTDFVNGANYYFSVTPYTP